MDEEELERMVVRIGGDASQYEKMLGDAAKHSRDAANEVQGYASQIEGFGNSIRGFAGNVVSALASFGAAGYLRSAFSAFQGREEMITRLNATLRVNNRDVQALGEEYGRFASQMSEVSTQSRSTVLSMLGQAEMFGLTGNAAEEAVQGAIALGAATGREAESMLMITVAMREGNVQMLRRLPGLRGIRDESTLVARAQEMMNRGMEVSRDLTQTSAHQLEVLARANKQLLADLGEVVAQGMGPYIRGSIQMVNWLRSLSAEHKTAFVVALSFIGLLVALPPLISAVGIAFNFWFGGLGITTGLIITAGAAIGAFILNVGGVGLAWEAVRNTSLRFWLWIRPTVMAGVRYIQGLWEDLKTVAASVWEWTKEKALDFWTWVRPIVGAGVGVIVAAWELARDNAIMLWEVVKVVAASAYDAVAQAWADIFGDTEVDWGAVRDFIVDALLMVEFGLRNVRQIAEFVWAGAQYYAVRFGNEVVYVVTELIPAAITWMAQNWRQAFQAVYEWNLNLVGILVENIVAIIRNVDWGATWSYVWGFVRTYMEFQVTNVVAVWRNIGRIIRGEFAFADLWRDETQQAVQASAGAVRQLPEMVANRMQPFRLPPRVTGELEEQLRREFERLGEGVAGSFNEFRDRRLRELGLFDISLPVLDRAEQTATDAGLKVGTGFANGAKKGMDKWDVALAGSAEAMRRIEAMRDHNEARGAVGSVTTSGVTPAAAAGTARAAPATAAGAVGAGAPVAADPQRERIVQLLTVANQYLRRMSERGADVQPAELV